MTAQEWIAAYGRAWAGRDPEAAVELFTEDAVYRSSPFREPHVGSGGIRDYRALREYWHVEEGKHELPPGWGG